MTKIRFASRKLRLGIRARDVVLDVGCGQFPNPRADVACDMLPENRERYGDLKIDRPFVWARAEKLPFAADAFDFVVLSHVLEHTFEPERLLTEIQRVGGRGYIETPAAWHEYLMPYRFHASRVDLAEDGTLQIRIKKSCDDGVDSAAPEIRAGLARVYAEIVNTRPELCMTRLRWTRPLRYRVHRDTPATWEKPSEASEPEVQSLAYRGLVNGVVAAVRPQRRVELNKLLACPDCYGALAPLSSNRDVLRCEKCSLDYGKRLGYYDFL